MDTADVEARLESYLREQFAVRPDDPRFSRSVDLYEEGYIDSVGVAELLEFLERELGVEVPEDDLLSDEFSSIAGIASVVTRLVSGPDGSQQ